MTDEIQTAAPESTGITQFSYAISELNILLEPTIRTEIVEQRDIFPIPHAPEWCQGMISLRGKLIPVIDIHRLLGRVLQAQSHWLLVIETADLPPAAIRIDHLPIQHQIQPDTLHPVTDDTLPFWIKRSAEPAGNLTYEADHAELFKLLVLQSQQSSATNTSKVNHQTHQEAAHEQ